MCKEFKKELKELLAKSFNVGECADTRGLYGEKLTVETYDKESRRYKTIVSVSGWSMSQEDIEK